MTDTAVTRVRDVGHLGDFSVTPRLLTITALAVPVGAVSACVAWALLRLIGLITNAVFYHRLGTALVAPDGTHHNPALILLAPVVGGLVIGLMARYGSEKIRGHGMPEAIEAILIGGSKVQPRVRCAQAGVLGDRDRHRRAVRRRGADHHDRRRHRVAVRAAAAA